MQEWRHAQSIVFFISGHSGVPKNARGNIDRFRAIAQLRNQGHDKWMSLIACGSIHEGHEWFSDDSWGRQEIFMWFGFIMWAILPIREGRCQDIDQVLLHEIIFFLSLFSSREVTFGVNCRLQLAGLGKKREETVKPTCFMSKATSVPQTPQKNHLQFSSPAEALNLIVESKSQPVELDNSTIEFIHVPSRRKKSLQSYCSVDLGFPCFNAIWYDLWCHVAWRFKSR